jgi:hypothetical protein
MIMAVRTANALNTVRRDVLRCMVTAFSPARAGPLSL